MSLLVDDAVDDPYVAEEATRDPLEVSLSRLYQKPPPYGRCLRPTCHGTTLLEASVKLPRKRAQIELSSDKTAQNAKHVAAVRQTPSRPVPRETLREAYDRFLASKDKLLSEHRNEYVAVVAGREQFIFAETCWNLLTMAEIRDTDFQILLVTESAFASPLEMTVFGI